MIYIKLPYTPFEPIGGVRTAFDYVMQLNAMAGKSIAKILADSQYLKHWLPKRYQGVKILPTSTKLYPTDILILPEVIAFDAKHYAHVQEKILLVLNWKYLSQKLTGKTLQSLGYSKILTNSAFSQTEMKKMFGFFSVHHIPHFIDKSIVKVLPFNKRAQHSVLILNRKNTHHIPVILQFLEGIRHTATLVNNIHPDQMQQLFNTHQYFINLGYPEGFCRPAAEAMTMGCIVVGFTGGGGSDFMVNEHNCFIAKDGDEQQLLLQLNKAIHLPIKEKIQISKTAQHTITSHYSGQHQAQALYSIFSSHIGKKFQYKKSSVYTTVKNKKIPVSRMIKSHEILEYQLFQLKQQYRELTNSKLYLIWQSYCSLKTRLQKYLQYFKDAYSYMVSHNFYKIR